jgi:hypothetical protein
MPSLAAGCPGDPLRVLCGTGAGGLGKGNFEKYKRVESGKTALYVVLKKVAA